MKQRPVRLRGKDVMTRAQLRRELIAFNAEVDGPWEPAVAAAIYPGATGGFCYGRARVVHDPEATHDIHLPGDGALFDVEASVAKLLIAEVLELP